MYIYIYIYICIYFLRYLNDIWLFKVGGNVARYSITGSTKKKANIHNSEELIQKVWESVRSNNGIMVCVIIC